ncbi:MAG: hypothetical protein E5V92_17930 [Mesorhizobium sp.]|nr:MAG: hypothetical protein EOS61_07810 [Mesorhizobium sp.]TJW83575.1 MAG: hypothetical protein E5V92_17930 [Mesorhizobium sp.]
MILIAKDSVFNQSQKISILLILGPVFSIYFVSVVRGFIETQADLSAGSAVNYNFVAIAIFLPVVQLAAVFYLLYSYPGSIAADTDGLQRWISALEVFLGGTVGLVVDNLFPKKTAAP